MGLHAQGVHRRVDALVELLRQEGMLDSRLPLSRGAEGKSNVPEAGPAEE